MCRLASHPFKDLYSELIAFLGLILLQNQSHEINCSIHQANPLA